MAKRVLIVDDDPKSLKMVSDLLRRFSYEVIGARDGEQGLRLAHSEMPGLILMDIMLPKIDGLEAARILKSDPSTKNIPIVALTAYAMKGDMERTLEAGCDGYIAKPIDIKNLLKTVRQFLPGV